MIVDQSILDYEKEKELTPQTDIFGNVLDNRRSEVAVGVSTAAMHYKGDYPDPINGSGFQLDATYSTSPAIGWELALGMNKLATKRFYSADVSYLELNAQYRLLPFDVFSPVLTAGGGFITENRDSRFDFSSSIYPKAQAGVGFEYALSDKWTLKSSVNYHYLFSDQLDLVEQGKYNDFYWRGSIGLNFQIGKKVKSERAFNFIPESEAEEN